jgi:hypothetical protein
MTRFQFKVNRILGHEAGLVPQSASLEAVHRRIN